jgi:hypothetical protein
MAQFLVQKNKLKELVYAVTEPVQENVSLRTIDRLLSGAAEEEIFISFLIFHIAGIETVLSELGIRRVRKLSTELLTILTDKTPDDLYVDCLGLNEYALLMPGVQKDKAQLAGVEIRKRFLDAAEITLKETGLAVNLVGCVIAFPEVGKNTVELLCRARDTLFQAGKENRDSIQVAPSDPLKPFALALPGLLTERLTQYAQKQSASASFVIQQALDEFLHKNKNF